MKSSWKFFVGLVCVGLPATVSLAQGTIVSPDGLWRADIDGFGQVNNFFTPDQPNTDNVFESIIYEATEQNNQRTWRVEDHYIQMFKVLAPDRAHVRLEKIQGRPLSIDVFVRMLNGPQGGAQYDIFWTNKGAPGTPPISVKPFFYVDFDISGTFGNDEVRKLPGPLGWEQFERDPAGVPIKPLWFGGKEPGYKSWEADSFPNLRARLDEGILQLQHSSGPPPPADFTTALSGEKLLLEPGERLAFRFGIGGPGIPEPTSLALLGIGALALARRRR